MDHLSSMRHLRPRSCIHQRSNQGPNQTRRREARRGSGGAPGPLRRRNKGESRNKSSAQARERSPQIETTQPRAERGNNPAGERRPGARRDRAPRLAVRPTRAASARKTKRAASSPRQPVSRASGRQALADGDAERLAEREVLLADARRR